MTERLITHLRHVDLAVPDYDKQLEFYTNTWGLSAETTDDGIAFLAAEGSPEQYSVRLRRADEKRLDLISFGAANQADVEALAERLGTGGVQLVGEPDKLEDPGRGLRLPVLRRRRPHHRGLLRRRGARAPQDRGGRVDPGQALARRGQHPDPGEDGRLLRRVPPVRALGHPDAPAHGGDDVFPADEHLPPQPGHRPRPATSRCTTRRSRCAASTSTCAVPVGLLRAGVEKVWGPGRHMAGNNTFSYFLDPHGNTIEYTTELEQLDEDTWHPSLYDFTRPEVADQWGTANPMSEMVAKQSFNDVDRGVFVAPPV